MSNTAGVLKEAGTAYPLLAPEFTPGFLVGYVLLILLVFLCCPVMCHCVLSSVLRCPLRFPHGSDVRFVLPPVVCRRAHVLFIFIFFSLRIVVSNT